MSDSGSGNQTGTPTIIDGRLHRAAIVLWSVRVLVPLALLLFAGSLERTLVLAGAGVVILGGFVRWIRFRWRLGPDTLVIEQGLLERRQRIIPLERIQAVQTVRKLQHRVLGVVGLRIEVIGGTQSEGQLDALDPRTADHIRERLLRGRAAAPAEPSPAPEVLARADLGTLIIAGLTGGRIGVAAALLALAEQLFGARLATTVVSAPERLGLYGVLTILIIGAVAVFLLSLAATALAYWGFTLARDGSHLLIRRGLLDERSDTIPLSRVQAVSVEENAVRRLLGVAALKIVVAGRAGGESTDTSVLFPLIARARGFALVVELFGRELEGLALRPMPRGARDRRLVRAAVVSIAAAGLGLAAAGTRGLLAAAVGALAVPIALGAYRALGYARTDGLVVTRAGWLVRRTTTTPLAALQTLSIISSPFQRRRRLATLRLEIARNPGRRDPRIIDLDDGTAEGLLLTLSSDALSGVQASDTPVMQSADVPGPKPS